MITLEPIHEDDFLAAAAVRCCPDQQAYAASAPMILARAYAYRNQRAVCWGICQNERIVGLALVHDLQEEPACYHLQQFLIDAQAQGKDIGLRALRRIMQECSLEGKFPRMEVCVNRENIRAIRMFEKAGFHDSGYTDPDAPHCLCMTCNLPAGEVHHEN